MGSYQSVTVATSPMRVNSRSLENGLSVRLAAPLEATPLLKLRAWLVEPLIGEYFCVKVPEGEVAPSSTVLDPLSRRLAIDCGVCTSPRTSIVVSRFGR